MLTYLVVSDRYFETVGAELVEGQAFSTGDRPDGAAVAVVNEAAAAAARGAIHQPPRAGDDDLQAVEGVRQRVTTVASLGHDRRAGSVPSRGGEGARARRQRRSRRCAPRIPSRPVFDTTA